jgi:tRNA (guanine-N7-)-methyltransferase
VWRLGFGNLALGVRPSSRPFRRVTYKPEFLARITERRAALRMELAALLPPTQAIVWEIGSGHGHFLVQYAQAFPEKFCVGVDIIRDRLNRSGKKRDRAQLTNCHFVQAEAREFFDAVPAGVTLQEIWVLFPDPWPKKRHHKNRIMQAEFLEALAARAGEGAPLYFRTDHAEYFTAVAALFLALKTWRIDPTAAWPLEQETVFQARARAYQSLVAIRTSLPARPAETAAPRPPPPVGPR